MKKELEKEKGFFRRFLEWLRTIDENEIEDGKINIKAFKNESRETINALNGTTKSVDHTASNIFTDRDAKRVVTINGMKVNVTTPNMEANGKKNQIIENYLEQ